MLDKAGISSSIELGAAQVLAIKAGLAKPWYKLRLLRWYVTSYTKSTNSSSLLFQVAQIVRRLRKGCATFPAKLLVKGEIALFSFPIPSGGEEIKGAPLVYIPQLVDKVVQLLEGNER